KRVLADLRALRQRDPRFGAVDIEIPAIAGRVPVKLVELLEEADLPRRAIADPIAVLPAGNEDIGAADARAHAVRPAFDLVRLVLPVARHRNHAEADIDHRAVAVA